MIEDYWDIPSWVLNLNFLVQIFFHPPQVNIYIAVVKSPVWSDMGFLLIQEFSLSPVEVIFIKKFYAGKTPFLVKLSSSWQETRDMFPRKSRVWSEFKIFSRLQFIFAVFLPRVYFPSDINPWRLIFQICNLPMKFKLITLYRRLDVQGYMFKISLLSWQLFIVVFSPVKH